MSNQRKAAPALYELIGRQTRVTSGTQIGGRVRSDDDDDRHAKAVPPPGSTGSRPPQSVPQKRHAEERAPDEHRGAPAPLHIARPPVHSPTGTTGPTPRPETDAPHPDPIGASLGPGRAVRVPTGYFLFGVAAVIAASIGGYMFGWVQKEHELSEAERQEATRTASTLTEPLGEEPSAAQRRPIATNTPRKPDAGTASNTPSNAPTTRTLGVIIVEKGVADPRQVGKNYAVVASLGKERAVELAEFLATSGVESAVLPRNNAGLYPVVSLTGFTKDEFRAKSKDHENRLRELGKQFAKQGGGKKDFSDLWWWRFDG